MNKKHLSVPGRMELLKQAQWEGQQSWSVHKYLLSITSEYTSIPPVTKNKIIAKVQSYNHAMRRK